MKRIFFSNAFKQSAASNQIVNRVDHGVFHGGVLNLGVFIRHKSCGIIGLPNVGKSSLFNALTKTQAAESANYPFCTVEPNTATVTVSDIRLDKLSDLAQADKKVLSQLQFTDVAGLVRNAHKGEGLGNQFLGNIRECNVVLHVLRCFDDENIIHVDSHVDPVADLEVVETELILADLDSVEKRIAGLNKKLRASRDEVAQLQVGIMEKCQEMLAEGRWVAEEKEWTDEERVVIHNLNLLTSKPMAYVCNTDYESAVSGNKYTQAVDEFIRETKEKGRGEFQSIITSSILEEEVLTYETEEERSEYLEMAGLEQTGLQQVIDTTATLLRQHVYYTVGKVEARSWVIPIGATAAEAAGKIHSDMQKGFIKADVIRYDDFVGAGGEENAKDKGLMRQEGKDYIVQDGDIMNFKFHTK